MQPAVARLPEIRVAIIGEQRLLVDALESRLSLLRNVRIACTLSDPIQGWNRLAESAPEVGIVDLSGRSARLTGSLSFLRSQMPNLRVIFITDDARGAAQGPAVSFIVQRAVSALDPLEDLIQAVQELGVESGRKELVPRDTALSTRRARINRLDTAHPRSLQCLTERELEVVKHLARGDSVKDVARLLGLAPKSIESHKYNIMKKLQIHDRVELALFAIRNGVACL